MTLIKRADKGEALTYEELDGNFTHLGGDGSYQFPATDGLASQVLTTDGNGNLTFQTINLDEIRGDIKGSVFADDSTLLVDAVNGKIVGPIQSDDIRGSFIGNVFLDDSTSIIDDLGQITTPRIDSPIIRSNTLEIVLGRRAADRADEDANSYIAIGYQAFRDGIGDKSVNIGHQAGHDTTQNRTINIGSEAGYSSRISANISIGDQAGVFNNTSQSTTSPSLVDTDRAFSSVFIGYRAGNLYSADGSVAIGAQAGYNRQQYQSVAIGAGAGFGRQGNNSIAIGYQAGYEDQGDNAICIGTNTAPNQPSDTIIITTSNVSITPSGSNELYINPIREVSGGSAPAGFSPMYYNPTTKEVIVVTP
jgi:hypothetical protein